MSVNPDEEEDRRPVAQDPRPDRHALSRRPANVGFLLAADFILLSYASATEVMRGANAIANTTLYQWWNITADGGAARSATGALIPADYRIGEEVKLDMLLIIGSAADLSYDDMTLTWLRRLSRQGVRIAGISASAAIPMAAAGLLDGHRCAIHWLHAASFQEQFPDLTTEQALYVIDGNLITCAGSGAALDLMCSLVEIDHGAELAQAVPDWLIHGARPRAAPQRRSISERVPGHSRPLLRAVAQMEKHIEEPLTREELADAAGVSLRQLERLFIQHLGTTMMKHYRTVRLDHARELLRRTAFTIGDIALASGFSSLSYFSRAFKRQFGCAPTARRSFVL